jgi:hypothetical protein
MRRAAIPTSSEASVNPGGGRNRAGFPVWNAGAREAAGRRVARKVTVVFVASSFTLHLKNQIFFSQLYTGRHTAKIWYTSTVKVGSEIIGRLELKGETTMKLTQ